MFLKKRYKISGIPVKSHTIWKNPQKYIPVVRSYFYYIFMTHDNVNLWEKIPDGSIEFHHFVENE